MATDAPESQARRVARLPQRQILADDVYESLKALVMDHAIEPGARMNIDGLARDLGVSQTPVREALARLESDGLAVKEPLRGYTATPLLSRADFEQLFEVRFLLEPWATARAAEQVTPADRKLLKAELAQVKDVPAEGDYDAYRVLTSHDQRFHAIIQEMSGNLLLKSLFEKTHCHLHIFRLYYGSGIGLQAVAEHKQIAAAITAGDPAAAESAMRDHLTASRDRLRPVLG
jgi:DNA-binding GntR family transcriptional regulator